MVRRSNFPAFCICQQAYPQVPILKFTSKPHCPHVGLVMETIPFSFS